MIIVFCSDPLQRNRPDSVYSNEYEAAKANGLEVGLISLEALLGNEQSEAVARNIPRHQILMPALYRGWMLKPVTYARLYDILFAKNIELINTPDSYHHCHHLPASYDIICAKTAKTIWFSKNQIDCDIEEVFRQVEKVFGDSAVIVKDYVKSRKHEWDDACFIPRASDHNNLMRVTNNFLQRQGDELNEGLVFREFLPLKFLTNHTKSAMPLAKEFRLFFLSGALLQVMYYWDEGNYSETWPDIEPFLEIARNIKSSFFTMDIAETEDGRWKVIELGDGQVSGLPDNADVYEFYAKIKQFRLLG